MSQGDLKAWNRDRVFVRTRDYVSKDVLRLCRAAALHVAQHGGCGR